ncbi:MAG: penicillin-binding protein 2 [Candidatus Taylorbacteria bacterium]|nr:penicillin-binding protein 2 [Candidatus Taylorbacteria bacterium]
MRQYANLRINIFLVVVLVASSLILYRLFVLSVVNHHAYLRTAQAQNENISNILARGNIYLSDKSSEPVLAAVNKKFPLAHIIPVEITDKEKVAEKLSEALNLDKEELIKKINLDSQSIRVIARRLTNDQVEAIKNLKLKGVGVSYEMDRFYPGEKLAANIIGFLGYNAEGRRAGQYGVEEYYDRDLFGSSDSGSGPNQPGNVTLTVDKNIQNFIEEKLKAILEKWEAEKGSIIVQEPESGKILAMADWPTFNPNNYSGSPPEYFLNGSIQEVYEPGSSFKPVTMAAGLDLSKITPQTSYEDKGFVNISGYTIHNFSGRVFGIQTMAQVLQNSVNTGVMFVENLIGDDNFLNYVINMGFGQKTGLDLPGEVSGDVTNLYSGRKINYLTASFGQGIAVTPLQLINAYSTIANGGKLMRPYIVDKITKEGGQEIVTKPEVVSIPISEKTAVKLQSMLVSVVDNGFDRARINGYDIAGKTGTAQMPDGSGGYSEDEFIHNFVGFAPAYNAKFVILIKMDKPKGITFAADSLSPVFKDIAAFLLNYYNIPPTRQ